MRFFSARARVVRENPMRFWAWSVAFVLVLAGVVGMILRDSERKSRAAEQFFALIDPLLDSTARLPEASMDDTEAWVKLASALADFESSSPPKGFKAVSLLFRGRALMGESRFEEAREAFRDAGRRFPGRYAYLGREGEALALMEMERWDEAAEIWKPLSRAADNPLRDRHLWNLGITQEGAGRSADAIETYKQLESEFQTSPLLEKVRTRLNLLAAQRPKTS